MQLALLNSQCTLSHTHLLLSKTTVYEKLTLLRNAFVPWPFSAAATHPLLPKPKFASTTYYRLQSPTTLLTHLPGLPG